MTVDERNNYLIVGGVIIIIFGPQILGFLSKFLSGQAIKSVKAVGEGIVVGAGEAIGIPPTDATRCEADIASGATWDASFDCPAQDFLKYLFNVDKLNGLSSGQNANIAGNVINLKRGKGGVYYAPKSKG